MLLLSIFLSLSRVFVTVFQVWWPAGPKLSPWWANAFLFLLSFISMLFKLQNVIKEVTFLQE